VQIERFLRELEESRPWAHEGGIERGELYLKRWRKSLSRWPRVQPYMKRCQIEAIVHLALHGALRRDEIFNMPADALHPDNEYLVVASARKNPEAQVRLRAVPWMTAEVRLAVGRWLTLREELAPAHDRAWLSLHTKAHRLKPMRHRRFEMLLRNVGRGWEYHRMRHTAATEMLRRGMPLDSVSRIIGHTRLEQTRAYLRVLPDDLVKAAARIEADYSQALARAA
jgi:site-specific recombinase XerD